LCLLGIVAGINATAVDDSCQSTIEDGRLSTGFWSNMGRQMGFHVHKFTEDLFYNVNNMVTSFHVKEHIDNIRDTMKQLVSTTEAFRTQVEDAVKAKGITMEDVSNDLTTLFEQISEQLAKEFPPPDTAPSHQERREMVAVIMKRLEDGTVQICGKWGIQQETMRKLFSEIGPIIGKLIVLIGDFSEQHPTIVRHLMNTATFVVLPQTWLFRSIFIQSLWAFSRFGHRIG